MATPWHLIPINVREELLTASRDNVSWAFAVGRHDQAEAIEAAFQLLRDAAPYPDEAIVFAYAECGIGEHLALVDIGWHEPGNEPLPNALVCEDADGAEAPYHADELRPLTIAAHEALEWLRGEG